MYYSLTLELVVLLVSFRYLLQYCILQLEIRQRTTRQYVVMYYFSLFLPCVFVVVVFCICVVVDGFCLFNWLKRKGNVKYTGNLEVCI